MSESVNELWERAINEHNRGDFHEAHEIFEDIWLELETRGEKDTVQTLAQADALAVHLETGNLGRFVTDFPTPELIKRSTEKNDVVLLPHLGASTKEAEVNCAVMAANQMVNYLKHGTIVNSVNFPRISLSRGTHHRLVIINHNEPGMISKITDSIAACGINIAEMTNKSKDKIAINLIDLEFEASSELIQQLESVEHVLSVRSLSI